MRKLRKTSMAAVLALMLAPSALAGITDTPPAPVPPPEASSATATGTIETPPNGAQSLDAPTDPVVDVALELMQIVLSLF